MICNLSWGASFALVRIFRTPRTYVQRLSQKFLQIQNLHRHYFDGCFELSLSQILADCDSLHESATNRTKLCNISSLRDFAKQNRGKPPCRFCDSQNLPLFVILSKAKNLKKKKHNRDSSVATLPQNDKFGARVAESRLDSALRNLIINNRSNGCFEPSLSQILRIAVEVLCLAKNLGIKLDLSLLILQIFCKCERCTQEQIARFCELHSK